MSITGCHELFVYYRGNDEDMRDPLQKRIEPLWWDSFANNGLGAWTTKFCHLISARKNLVWFRCTRLGYYGYRVTSDKSFHDGVSKHKVSILCLYTQEYVYVKCYIRYKMILE